MNLDPRSNHLNTEIGLLIDDRRLAGAAAELFERMISSDASYSVVLDQGAAATYCTSNRLAGYADWRLPTERVFEYERPRALRRRECGRGIGFTGANARLDRVRRGLAVERKYRRRQQAEHIEGRRLWGRAWAPHAPAARSANSRS